MHIQLERFEPELYIEETEAGYKLKLSHWNDETGLIVEKESLHKYRLINFSQEFVHIARLLSKDGLTVPASAKDRVVHMIQHTKQDIRLNIGITDSSIIDIKGDPTLYLQLVPTKEVLVLA